jgi:toxin ParE1/3/4
MNVVFEKEALDEYFEAARHSESHFGLGKSFVSAIEESLALIANDPGRFQDVGMGIRIFRMRRFPFYLFYQHLSEQNLITIYAVAHHARRPDYWRERIPTDP